MAWVQALAVPLHRRAAWRLASVVVGILTAHGRRTASSWWRAAAVGDRFRSYYYFLDAVGRKTAQVAAVLLGLVLHRIPPGERLLFAIDDTPTKRYGPEVQGAGIHHNPTPGPAGAKFLYGHNWVVLSRIASHQRFGTISLPLLGSLYVRRKDIPDLPAKAGIDFRTKLELATEQLAWAAKVLPESCPRWIAVDGAYAKREFLKGAKRDGFVVVARLRKDAALFDLPPVIPPGQKRGRGRPRIYGKGRLSLAKRAGQPRAWQDVEVRTTTGVTVTKQVKTFLATWQPAGGLVRVVIIKEADGSWRAFLCTAAEATVESIVQAAQDRWGIEQSFHDLKEVEGIEQVQLRRVWANVGALNINLWVHTLIELWAWDRPSSELIGRDDRPWDDAERRPSHADRRRALQRTMIEEEYRRRSGSGGVTEKIRQLFENVVRLIA